jgi:Fic family protein
MYLYELSDWPHFRWNADLTSVKLATVRHAQGRLFGRMETLGFPVQQETLARTLTTDAIESSEIEGESLNPEAVRSSVARRLGLNDGGAGTEDQHVEGIVEILVDATRHFDRPLTAERLFGWHAALFPTGYSGIQKIRVGAWREGAMQVVSGFEGQQRVHFVAPPAARMEQEMRAFLSWFNGGEAPDLILKSALAHLWFVIIHPFDDGNGRIGRAISDLLLARSEAMPQRFYSLSMQLRKERASYYEQLRLAQSGSMDVTAWLIFFLNCMERAIASAQDVLDKVMDRSRFWQSIAGLSINERQRLILSRLLEGFKGNLTSAKWAKLAKCSPDTALRDISSLVEQGVLIRSSEGGRSTNYTLKPRHEAKG